MKRKLTIRFIHLQRRNKYQLQIKGWFGWKYYDAQFMEYSEHIEDTDGRILLDKYLKQELNLVRSCIEITEHPPITVYGNDL